MFEGMGAALIMLAAIITIYPALSGAAAIKGRFGAGALQGLDWLLCKTPAREMYFSFVIQAMLVITAAAFAFRISNHIILTLEIIFLMSCLILILYHIIKIETAFSFRQI